MAKFARKPTLKSDNRLKTLAKVKTK